MDFSAVRLAEEIRQHNIKATEAVQFYLDQIARLEPEHHALITVDAGGALNRAEQLQKQIDAGEQAGALAGVPVILKDNLCTEGMRTTCGSRMLEQFVPTDTAEAVLRLERAGAIILGKANMDEFAMGSTTETSYFGVTKNPHHTEHVPGGSSGGSAAAVALQECAFALGTDTGGSVRQPAGYCGVVGMKPTYGTVSRYGLIAYASSLDQIGPLTRNVTDCAVILDTIMAQDVKDATSVPAKCKSLQKALTADVRDMRIGIPAEYLADGVQQEVREAVMEAARHYRFLGAVVEECSLGLTDYTVPAYYVIACAEAGSNLARYDGVKYGYRAADYEGLHDMYKKTREEGFGAEVKRRIMLGSFVLSSGYYEAYYLKALRARALIKVSFDRIFEQYDILLTPTTPSTAPLIGASLQNPLRMYMADVDTVAVNLAGLPAISIPCGKDSRGLPIGMQLIGDCFAEDKLIRAAFTYESDCGRCVDEAGV